MSLDWVVPAELGGAVCLDRCVSWAVIAAGTRPTLTDLERRALAVWANGGAYHDVQRFTRGGGPAAAKRLGYAIRDANASCGCYPGVPGPSGIVSAIDSAIAKGTVPVDAALIRGVHTPHVPDVKPGDEFQLDGYAATSFEPHVFTGPFDTVTLIIRFPAGGLGLHVAHYYDGLEYDVDEVLLPRDSVLRVLAVDGPVIECEWVGAVPRSLWNVRPAAPCGAFARARQPGAGAVRACR